MLKLGLREPTTLLALLVGVDLLLLDGQLHCLERPVLKEELGQFTSLVVMCCCKLNAAENRFAGSFHILRAASEHLSPPAFGLKYRRSLSACYGM